VENDDGDYVMRIDSEACIGCGVCVHMCKYSVLEMECKNERGLDRCFCVASREGDCVDCGRCIAECLAGAMST
jgi:NAD-dependent dihydropyrimidine dehydrogenase PreA subunit